MKAKTVKITSNNIISVLELASWSIDDQNKAIGADCSESVRTMRMQNFFQDSIVMIVDESGHSKNRMMNEVASWLYGADQHGDMIVGDIIFAVYRGNDFLPPENPELLKFFLMSKFPCLKEAEVSINEQ